MQENVGNQVVIDFSTESYWFRDWCEFSGSITEQGKAKPMQSRIAIDWIENCSKEGDENNKPWVIVALISVMVVDEW